jgi:hypothetical protein
MSHLFRSLALLIPPVRRLREDRNRYAEMVASLSGELEQLLAAGEQLRTERDRIRDDSILLQQRISEVTQELVIADAERTVMQSIVDSRSKMLSEIAQPSKLHVIGYARSGTTILMDILNSSNDIFLFSELNLHVLRKYPDLFSHYIGDNFIMQFFERKKRELPMLYKGAYPPTLTALTDQSSLKPDDYINYVGRKYRYIGDKIASAHRTLAGVSDLVLLKEFLEQEQDSWLFFTLRRPSENLVSISAMFPEANLREWAISVTETIIVIINAFMRGNRAYLVFHDDIGPQLINELSSLLDTHLAISPSLVGADHQALRGQTLSLDEPLVAKLDACYIKLYDLYKCDSGVLKHSKTDGLAKNVAKVVKSLDEIVKRLSTEQEKI